MAYYYANLRDGYRLRLGVWIKSSNISANTTTWRYNLALIKGSGTGKWANGTANWSVRSPNSTVLAHGSINNYDFRGRTEITLVSTRDATFSGSSTRQWVGVFDDIPTYGELGNGVVTVNVTPPAIPLTPTGLTVTRNSDSSHTLNWSRTSVYTAVVVQRSTDGGSWTQVGRPTGNAFSFTDTTTSANHQYRYRVAGVAAAGQSGWSGTATVYTTPAPPTGVSAQKVGSDIRVTATGLPPYATAYDVYDGGTLVGSNVSSFPWTHSSPNASVTHTYTVRSKRGSLVSAHSSPSNTVQLLAPPNPPTGLSPNGGTTASDEQVRFEWGHNPVDTTDQTAFELRYRLVGGAWTTVSGTTASFHEALLPVGGYEWQVRTKGDHPNFSGWSATATVLVLTSPGVAIISPEEEWNASLLTAEWTWNQDEGHPQSSWEAQLLDPEQEVVETRTGSGPATTVQFHRRVSEGEWTVRVRAASGTVWSGWAEQAFDVVFYPPATPTLDGSWVEDLGGVSLEISAGFEEGTADTVRLLVERSVDGETWETFLDLTETDESVAVSDFESLSFGDTQYRATAFTAEGATAEASLLVEARSETIWLSGGPGFFLTGPLPFNPRISIAGGRERALKQYAGRTLPVSYAGEAVTRTVQVSGVATDRDLSGMVSADTDLLLRIVESEHPVHLFRDPDGRRVYGQIGQVQLSRDMVAAHPDGWNGLWGYSFTLTATERD